MGKIDLGSPLLSQLEGVSAPGQLPNDSDDQSERSSRLMKLQEVQQEVLNPE
jgi:hypothetical protein